MQRCALITLQTDDVRMARTLSTDSVTDTARFHVRSQLVAHTPGAGTNFCIAMEAVQAMLALVAAGVEQAFQAVTRLRITTATNLQKKWRFKSKFY